MINKKITKNIFKILHRELTVLSGNRLEIRFLKVLGLLAIFSFGTLGFLEWIEQPKQFFIDNFLVRGVPAVAV